MPWGPQQPGQGPPPKRGSAWKWALGAVALLAVIGVTVAVTLALTGRGSNGDTAPTAAPPTSGNGQTSEFASANDTGPATIITEDPSCAAWTAISGTLADREKNGWDRRDPSVPAADWTPDQRAQHEAVGQAMRTAADQTVGLAKQTPHRVMRELYEQFIAYSRAYADAIPTYTQADNHLAGVVGGASSALVYICSAITNDSAHARAPLVPEPAPPSRISPLDDPASPQRFLSGAEPVCPDWSRLLYNFDADTTAWQAIDSEIPAGLWNPEQRSTVDAVVPVMKAFADEAEDLARRSTNPTLQDFAMLAAQYRRAYAAALSTYMPADAFLSAVSANAASIINDACMAAHE
jgi:hypothetical protein